MANYFNTGKSLHSNAYRPDIDGLRAIAVSSVVIGHAFQKLLPGGFIGVDIFFVISGYLISSILIRDLQADKFSILTFYSRRIRRIFPALVAVLFFIMAFGWYCLFNAEFSMLGRHINASSTFVENFLLWSEVSYFDVASNLKPTLHLWSLSIEEQFYIFWPILMFIAYKRRWNILGTFIALAAASFIINVYQVNSDATAAYYSPADRSWELMFGACLAYVSAYRPKLLGAYKNAQSLVGLSLIVIALMLIRSDSAFPGFWALLPTLGAMLLISAEGSLINRHLLAAPPMVWCGLISYPLYLWHWPLLSFGHIIFGYLTPMKAAGCIIVAVIAATLTFFFIERPFRKHDRKPAKPLFLVGAMVSTLTCGVLIATQTVSPRLKSFDAPTRHEWDFLRARTANFDKYEVGIYPLEANRPDGVLFIGDSRIAQYAEYLNKMIVSDPEGKGALLAIGGGCIPLEGVISKDPNRAKCWPMREEAYRLAEQKKFSTIVIGGAWNWYFLAGDYAYVEGGKSYPVVTPKGREMALQRLGQRINALKQSGKHVIFMLDNPRANEFYPGGRGIRLSQTAQNFQPSSMVNVDPHQIELRKTLSAWASKLGVDVIDPFAAVCRGKSCFITSDTGQPMYKDQSHFNPDWAIDHVTFMDDALRKDAKPHLTDSRCEISDSEPADAQTGNCDTAAM